MEINWLYCRIPFHFIPAHFSFFKKMCAKIIVAGYSAVAPMNFKHNITIKRFLAKR